MAAAACEFDTPPPANLTLPPANLTLPPPPLNILPFPLTPTPDGNEAAVGSALRAGLPALGLGRGDGASADSMTRPFSCSNHSGSSGSGRGSRRGSRRGSSGRQVKKPVSSVSGASIGRPFFYLACSDVLGEELPPTSQHRHAWSRSDGGCAAQSGSPRRSATRGRRAVACRPAVGGTRSCCQVGPCTHHHSNTTPPVVIASPLARSSPLMWPLPFFVPRAHAPLFPRTRTRTHAQPPAPPSQHSIASLHCHHRQRHRQAAHRHTCTHIPFDSDIVSHALRACAFRFNTSSGSGLAAALHFPDRLLPFPLHRTASP